MVFAIDFDGTLVENEYPEIGEPKLGVINFCKKRQELGDNIILWTCRTGNALKEAVSFLKDKCGFIPNYINENAPWDHTLYEGESRKIGADYYIDDKAISVYDIDNFIDNFEELNMNNNIDNDFLNKVDRTIATNKSMTSKQLEDYLNNINSTVFQTSEYSGLEDWKPYIGKCPYCGSETIEANHAIVLTSTPPQYNCRCKNCSATFYSGQLTQENQTITPHLPNSNLPSYPNQPQKPKYGYGMREGWICPRCGKVNSPDRDFCDCSGNGGWSSPIVWCNADSSGKYVNPNPSITISQDSNINSKGNEGINIK